MNLNKKKSQSNWRDAMIHLVTEFLMRISIEKVKWDFNGNLELNFK